MVANFKKTVAAGCDEAQRVTRARVGVRAAQVDPRKIETYIYVYGGELAGPMPRLRQAVLNVTPRPIAMWSLN